MKKLIFSLILLSTVATVKSQSSDTAINKIRTVRIKGNLMVLGQPIEKLNPAIVQSDAKHFHLKMGTFGGADSIDIEITPKQKIKSISFFYDTVSTYDYEVDLFNKHLNLVGKETKSKSPKGEVKTTKWEDKHTSFEMIEVRNGNRWKLHSVIKDKNKE